MFALNVRSSDCALGQKKSDADISTSQSKKPLSVPITLETAINKIKPDKTKNNIFG